MVNSAEFWLVAYPVDPSHCKMGTGSCDFVRNGENVNFKYSASLTLGSITTERLANSIDIVLLPFSNRCR